MPTPLDTAVLQNPAVAAAISAVLAGNQAGPSSEAGPSTEAEPHTRVPRTTEWRKRKKLLENQAKSQKEAPIMQPKQPRKQYSCRICGDPMTSGGHTQFFGKLFCPNAPGAVSKEEWLSQMRQERAAKKAQQAAQQEALQHAAQQESTQQVAQEETPQQAAQLQAPQPAGQQQAPQQPAQLQAPQQPVQLQAPQQPAHLQDQHADVQQERRQDTE